MSTRAALAAGTALSAAVTSAWSWTAMMTIGPAALPRFGGSVTADYASLAAAPTGNGPALFAAIAVIYALCLLASGWRQQRKHVQAGGEW